MAFHRFTVPSYSGGLRSGDDYVNNAVTGTPAPAAGQISSGTYINSYFLGMNEAVTAATINRGFKALATNTDYLDDQVTAAVTAINGAVSSAATNATNIGNEITNRTNADTAIQGNLTTFINLLASSSGEANVSGPAVAGATYALSAGTLASQISALTGFNNTLSTRVTPLETATTALADIPALKALTVPANGTMRYVYGYGLYTFDTSSAAAESLPQIVQPTVGSGRWISETANVANRIPNGYPTLSAAGKVAATQVPMRLVSVAQVVLAANVAFTATAMGDVSGYTLSAASLVAGDIVVVDAVPLINVNSITNLNTFKLLILDGATVVDTGTLSSLNTTATTPFPLQAVYTVVTGGTLIAKIQAAAGSTQTMNFLGNASTAQPQSRLRLTVYRP